jgi:tetratricopeptide (TPR) repeat protein
MPQVTALLEIGDFSAMGAWIHFELGRYGEALAHAQAGIDRIAGRGPNVELHCRSWMVLALERLGRWDEAIAQLEAMRAVMHELDGPPPYFCSASFAAAGTIHAFRDERVQSDELAELVASLSPRQGIRLYPSAIKLLLARGEVDEARERGRPDGWRTMTADTYEAEAELLAARGAWDEVPAMLDTMRDFATLTPSPSLEAAADRLEGQVALAAGDTDRGLASLAAASATYAELECVWERAVTDLLIAEAGAPDASARAGRAAEAFGHLRTQAHLARARAVLAALRTGGGTN